MIKLLKPLAAAVLVAASGSCRTPLVGHASMESVPATRLPPPPPSSGNAVEDSSVRIDYIPAHARKPLAQPLYPGSALKARAGEHIVYATFTVDESGHISDIRPSWNRITLRSEFSDLFFQAVSDAIATWDLEPAHQVYWQRVPNEDDRYLRTEAVAETIEMKFTFETSGTIK